MANHLFRLDLSDGAEDFQKTATEPGLAMLDASGANYATLNRWLGDFAAEPMDTAMNARNESASDPVTILLIQVSQEGVPLMTKVE